MFHRRYADQTAEVWAQQFSKVPVNKKLYYLYLANEVVQQSKAKKKEEFVVAFAKVLPNALESNYADFEKEIKARVKRVLDVWKQRQVFDGSVISDMESRIATLDAVVSSDSSISQGIFGSHDLPSQLLRLSNLQKQVNNLQKSLCDSLKQSQVQYQELFDSEALPAPPAYAAKLVSLSDKLKYSINSIRSCIVAKKDVCDELHKLLSETEKSVDLDSHNLKDLEQKVHHTETTKKEVEELLVEEKESHVIHDESRQGESHTDSAFDSQSKSQDIDSIDSIPAYSPVSSDEEHERKVKKPKIESNNVDGVRDTTPQLDFQSRQDDEYDPTELSNSEGLSKPTTTISPNIKDLEGLDPSVASFLTDLVQGSN